MRIAIASGKGGTGKTTVAVNLAAFLKSQKKEVSLLDCDVEEPNSHCFLHTEWDSQEIRTVEVPAIDEQKCRGESCLLCVQECRFKALIWMVSSVLVFPELCHSCGLCSYICPADAVLQSKREIGTLRKGLSADIPIYGGLLRVGEAMAPPLIKEVKKAAKHSQVQILDAPPGTSCPVIESIQDADFVVLVTEPTPFGLYDLKLAVGLMHKLQLPFGVVINRDGMGDTQVENYLEKEEIPVLARLPHSLEAATYYSKGQLLIHSIPEFAAEYERLWEQIQNLSLQGART